MRKFSKGILLMSLAALIGMTSCGDENSWSGSDTVGGIRLNLSTDGRVMRQTRADDSVCPVVPDGDSFGISLTKTDGSYSKTWSTVEAFNRESSFPIGDYEIEATYGSVEQEGFELPAYRGVSQVHVAPGEESDVNITATLANAMVSIRYTDEFKENVSAYSASIQTAGHESVVFAEDEDRPAFISPSEVKLNITLTNASGSKVTIQPASFTAEARHHYVVTIGVSGTYGNLALDVTFDEDVVNETVEVPLGEELWTSPAPTITAQGFTEETISCFEAEPPTGDYEYHVFAFGGIKSATLNLISSSYTPSFGKSVELVNASSTLQSQLSSNGIVCSGFFRNVDKMGVVNVTEFVKSLPAGTHTLQLQVVDNLTRTSDPVELKVEVKAVTVELSAVKSATFFGNEVVVDVATNTDAVKNNISFKTPDENNKLVEATIKSVSAVTEASGKKTRSDLEYNYRYVLEVSTINSSTVEVQSQYGNIVGKVSVPVSVPELSFEVDPFASYAVFKVSADGVTMSEVMDNLTFYNNGSRVSSDKVSKDASTGMVTITGLSGGTAYSSLKAYLGKVIYNVSAFTTEAATDVTNGDFSSTAETININPIQVGGKYRTGAFDYYNRTSIVRSEATGWASINELTAYTGSSTMNTWFVVPSTYALDGQVVVRSVGYSHNGTVPSRSGSFLNTNYYCENSPSESEFTKVAGELFLGSYSYTGTESRTDGISFSSRPTSLSFDYKYTSVNSESAEAYIKVFNASGEVIAQNTTTLSAASAMQTVTLTMPSYAFGSRAAKIQIGFRSTQSGVTPTINIPTGSSLKESGVSLNTNYYYTLSANNYHALATGSELVLDNVKLNYGAPSKGKARRSVKK